ncbi:MAG: DUF742 domain-containing protein [Mycobacteriales bacterium]|jgi:hypothetical protein
MTSPDNSSSLVRPYAMTGGRTRPRVQLALESLVTTTLQGTRDTFGLSPERRAIAELCQEVQSVAEIAARLRVPLGVARVLVGDMAEEGLVHVHQPGSLEDHLGLELLERVLSGLRKL